MSDARPAYCDGHEYEDVITYDLRDDFDRFAFDKKLGLLMDWFQKADDVYADEDSGHRHFDVGRLGVKCNVQKLSDRFRNIYYEVTVRDE